MPTVTQAVEALVRATAGRSDEDMGRPWVWRMYDEEGLRFALLMAHHELRDLAVRLTARRERLRTQAEAILGQYHQAYRDLGAVLAAVRDADLDRTPAAGEGPLREACAHMLGAEYGFLAVCAVGLARARSGNATEPDDTEWERARAPYAAARAAAQERLTTAGVDGVRDEFFEIHRRVLSELGSVRDDELETPAWFWDGAMPLRFRLHRFEEHLRQHTIQLDKTLVMLGRPPTEAHRLVRNLYAALADVEMERGPGDEERRAVADGLAARAREIGS